MSLTQEVTQDTIREINPDILSEVAGAVSAEMKLILIKTDNS